MRTKLLAFGVALLALFVALDLVVRVAEHTTDRVVFRNLSPYVWLFEGAPVEASYIPTPIKSIQRGTITLPSGVAGSTDTLTATITAVSTSAATVTYLSAEGAGGSYSNYVRLALTNSTTVTASHFRDQTTPVSFEVVEFLGNFVTNVQTGTIALASSVSTNTATIASVTTGKTALYFLGTEVTTYAGSPCPDCILTNLVLTNATTVTATRNTTTGAVTTGFAAVTWR